MYHPLVHLFTNTYYKLTELNVNSSSLVDSYSPTTGDSLYLQHKLNA